MVQISSVEWSTEYSSLQDISHIFSVAHINFSICNVAMKDLAKLLKKILQQMTKWYGD